MSSKPATVWLVRHGQRIDESEQFEEWYTSTPKDRRWDPPLTTLGIQQARDAGDVLSRTTLPFAALYASPKLRCMETASAVAEELSMPVKIVPGLAQCAAYVERKGLKTLLPKFVHKLPVESAHSSLAHQLFEGTLDTEYVDDTVEVFAAAIRRLAARHRGQHIVVVTHREGIRDIVQLSELSSRRASTPYCCITKTTIVPTKAADGEPPKKKKTSMDISILVQPTAPKAALTSLPLPDPEAELLRASGSLATATATATSDDGIAAGAGTGAGAGAGAGGDDDDDEEEESEEEEVEPYV